MAKENQKDEKRGMVGSEVQVPSQCDQEGARVFAPDFNLQYRIGYHIQRRYAQATFKLILSRACA